MTAVLMWTISASNFIDMTPIDGRCPIPFQLTFQFKSFID